MVSNATIKPASIRQRFAMASSTAMDFLRKMNPKAVKTTSGGHVKTGGVWEGGKMESILSALVWKVTKLASFQRIFYFELDGLFCFWSLIKRIISFWCNEFHNF